MSHCIVRRWGIAVTSFAAFTLLAAPAGAVIPGGDVCEDTVLPADRLESLIGVLDQIENTAQDQTLGDLANAVARKTDAEHDLLIERRGCGTRIGTQAGTRDDVDPAPRPTDCTIFVVETLQTVFREQGRAAEWDRVMTRALQLSRQMGPGGLKGIGLIRALVEREGWKGVFWAADPKGTSDPEHSFAAAVARRRGTYYKVPIERDKLVVGYRGAHPQTEQLEKLSQVPFGIMAARGGTHMALVLYGTVHEVHWSTGCGSRDLIQATSLAKFPWESGVIIMPPEDMQRAWGPSQQPLAVR